MKNSSALLYGGASCLAMTLCLAFNSGANAAISDGESGAAVTHYVRVADNSAAWAAPAKMNPDYVKGAIATGAAAGTPAWAAPATMNPDYKKGETAPTKAAEAAPPPATGGQATTSYYGGSAAPQNPAWAAPATMNSSYSKSSAVATPASSPSPTTATPVRDAALEACRSAITSAAAAAKLYFANGSATLQSGATAALKAMATVAKGCGNAVIEIAGHTDSTGTPASNKVLSEQRAKSVVDLLTSEGVPASKLKAVGYGQENPITTNDTPEGRRLNRRIEFLVTSH